MCCIIPAVPDSAGFYPLAATDFVNGVTPLGAFCKAFHKLSLVCMIGRLSGDVLVTFPILTAGSGLRVDLPFTSSDSADLASSYTELLL